MRLPCGALLLSVQSLFDFRSRFVWWQRGYDAPWLCTTVCCVYRCMVRMIYNISWGLDMSICQAFVFAFTLPVPHRFWLDGTQHIYMRTIRLLDLQYFILKFNIIAITVSCYFFFFAQNSIFGGNHPYRSSTWHKCTCLSSSFLLFLMHLNCRIYCRQCEWMQCIKIMMLIFCEE